MARPFKRHSPTIVKTKHQSLSAVCFGPCIQFSIVYSYIRVLPISGCSCFRGYTYHQAYLEVPLMERVAPVEKHRCKLRRPNETKKWYESTFTHGIPVTCLNCSDVMLPVAIQLHTKQELSSVLTQIYEVYHCHLCLVCLQ